MSTHGTTDDSGFTEGVLRAFAVLIYSLFVYIIARAWWLEPGRITLLLLLLTEGFTLALVLVARQAGSRDLSPVAVAATAYAAFFFMLFRYDDTARLVPEWVGAGLLFVGMGWQVLSKVALGRSFGLLPAARGLVTHGPYRLVRHPIYLGYLIAHLGFLLSNFSLRNLAVLVLLYLAQIVRMRHEEALLCGGDAQGMYRAYCGQVRHRLIPFVY